MSKEEIIEIKKEVLIKNNIHWLHTRERSEYQIEEGRVPITDKDLYEIIERVLNQIMTQRIPEDLEEVLKKLEGMKPSTIQEYTDRQREINFNINNQNKDEK